MVNTNMGVGYEYIYIVGLFTTILKERVLNNVELQYEWLKILNQYYFSQNSEFPFRESHRLTSD